MNVALALATVPLGPPVMVVSGATVSTVHDAARGRGVDVAGGVDGTDLEGVRALREAGVARGAGGEPGAVERALERRAGLARGVGERGAGAGHGSARARC